MLITLRKSIRDRLSKYPINRRILINMFLNDAHEHDLVDHANLVRMSFKVNVANSLKLRRIKKKLNLSRYIDFRLEKYLKSIDKLDEMAEHYKHR